MVEKLNLEQMYARRGIDLITPESGTQILARVLSQRPAHLVAITVDWPAARAASIAGQLPPMFAELGVSSGAEQSSESAVDADSILDGIRQAPEGERAGLVRDLLRDIAATVLNLDAADLGDEENLSNLGIDSMMAVEVKARIDIMLRVDIPVLDLLQGVSVVDLAARILPRLDLAATPDEEPEPAAAVAEPSDDELDQLLANASPEELDALLAELEREEGKDHEPAS
jgi:acyl carrier protein